MSHPIICIICKFVCLYVPLSSSIDAALTVTSDLNGDDDATLGKYEKKIKVEFSYFLEKNIYRRESRFPQSKYWNRF
jgi:hypothetical protein